MTLPSVLTDPALIGIIVGLLACYFLALALYLRHTRRNRQTHNQAQTQTYFWPRCLDYDGHRRMDPPINLRALDAAVASED